MVKDLERATGFFKCVFNAEEVYSSEDIGGQWIVIMEGESLNERTYHHVTFKIADEDFDLYESKVRSMNLHIRPPRSRVEGEGRSLYFYDFDNHLFELHTGTLAERLVYYRQKGR